MVAGDEQRTLSVSGGRSAGTRHLPAVGDDRVRLSPRRRPYLPNEAMAALANHLGWTAPPRSAVRSTARRGPAPTTAPARTPRPSSNGPSASCSSTRSTSPPPPFRPERQEARDWLTRSWALAHPPGGVYRTSRTPTWTTRPSPTTWPTGHACRPSKPPRTRRTCSATAQPCRPDRPEASRHHTAGPATTTPGVGIAIAPGETDRPLSVPSHPPTRARHSIGRLSRPVRNPSRQLA
jgi:hypothetical protein